MNALSLSHRTADFKSALTPSSERTADFQSASPLRFLRSFVVKSRILSGTRISSRTCGIGFRISASAAVLIWLAVSVQAAPAKTPAPAAAAPSAAPAAPAPVVELPIPQSVFVIPASPKEGRNPFFPRSAVAQQAVPKPGGSAPAMDTSSILLNGVSGAADRRLAIINNHTFSKGEESEIKLPNGAKILVKCEDIKEDSVIILVNGTQRRELRLRLGLQ